MKKFCDCGTEITEEDDICLTCYLENPDRINVLSEIEMEIRDEEKV